MACEPHPRLRRGQRGSCGPGGPPHHPPLPAGRKGRDAALRDHEAPALRAGEPDPGQAAQGAAALAFAFVRRARRIRRPCRCGDAGGRVRGDARQRDHGRERQRGRPAPDGPAAAPGPAGGRSAGTAEKGRTGGKYS